MWLWKTSEPHVKSIAFTSSAETTERSTIFGHSRRSKECQGSKALLPRLLTTLTILCAILEAAGGCRFGELPGTMQDGDGGPRWNILDPRCQLKPLLPAYLGKPQLGNGTDEQIRPVSILFLGDSVDRETVGDINKTALAWNHVDVESVLREHWRSAIKLPMLEMVYHFAPGSHPIGPYHDDVLWNKTIINALPRALELHRLVTGREEPDVFIFSDILWDLGRWLFLAEIAEPERMDHFGLPLLRQQEFLPDALLEQFRNDTEIQMQRIENKLLKNAVLIYHNAAFAQLRDASSGTEHAQAGMGRRTHLIQLNAMTRQIVEDNPRWHLVDIGAMSDSFLTGGHLRDWHHPNTNFMLQVVNLYLNLYHQHGSRNTVSGGHAIGDVGQWDQEYENRLEEMQADYAREAESEAARYHLRKEAAKNRMEDIEHLRHRPRHKNIKMLFNVTFGRH